MIFAENVVHVQSEIIETFTNQPRSDHCVQCDSRSDISSLGDQITVVQQCVMSGRGSKMASHTDVGSQLSSPVSVIMARCNIITASKQTVIKTLSYHQIINSATIPLSDLPVSKFSLVLVNSTFMILLTRIFRTCKRIPTWYFKPQDFLQFKQMHTSASCKFNLANASDGVYIRV